MTAAYLLAVAVSTPVHGSLGDRWGRRRTFAGSALVFAAGSLACALAPDVPALVAFRAVQGLGGSGLIVAAVAGLAELFDCAELVRRQGWLTAVFAVSAIGGAPLGGVLAATAGWRSSSC
ncbi:MFS transporter [Amycolatopsis sp. FDAARGOS 1241]|uniref:MFS transporter n=1 Tax=Amycolatopsis sp. FDAARGOS 1241 TaxID=2778070 RepID=UPI001EF339D6|nr:MFS transporter [Amycolatopsis sp. FDAARGOS 1241]